MSRIHTDNVDQEEISKFSKLANHWWDLAGELRTLHQINPLRLGYIEENTALTGKRVLDVGCGGGILAESMAKKTALVTGIDLSHDAILVAKQHAMQSGLQIQYELLSAEELAAQQPPQFDVVTCLELLEHVPKPQSIIESCAKLVKPGGHVFFSTINRNPKAYVFAILGAEYILRLLPKNTHDYNKFIKPSELATWCRQADLQPLGTIGMHYRPLSKTFLLSDDVSVNYLMHTVKS